MPFDSCNSKKITNFPVIIQAKKENLLTPLNKTEQNVEF